MRATIWILHRSALIFQCSHLFQKFVSALNFGRIHTADRETNMHHHVVAQSRFRNKGERHLPYRPADLHAGGAQRTDFLDFEDLSWYGEAHSRSPTASTPRVVTAICDLQHTLV